ncbi:fumarylacetoacetase [Variovorax arabinosiphilus]|uniref:fumarylacetoacetase n=1 Tax=Variovorax arabinosiphilus TaxID=3053498 RepID=UPI0025750ECB|nr:MULTISPECIES: fumarylacetoacetase [unclassified Variovorax]MDM0118386.1 fumarylacetoacetase [Variovorax sp. J2L1-78]MDM0128811.1 fumarylacetoacetase [Variovorax sp. J2L1-63]MDM0233403.1 fumarylacetoacetase [Variovorax sp. J2R1-6]
MTELDHTHDGSARSWVRSAGPMSDFPLQNLPLSVFKPAGAEGAFRGGIAIGDRILDLAALSDGSLLKGLAAQAARAASQPSLNALLGMGRPAWRALRHGVFALLRDDAPAGARLACETCLVPRAGAQHALPVVIGDYTDFYTSVDHALNIGRLYRPDDPLSANFRWMPIAYHGRVSSIGLSGERIRRPRGQWLAPGATTPVYGPSQRLDYELELGIYIGTGNTLGEPIGVADADGHAFGLCLLNDWSARDIQRWESTPLGPFQAKNFATTLSPWIVTMEALAPYRLPWCRAANEPQPLAHLDAEPVRQRGAFDVQLEVLLETAADRARGGAPQRLSATSFRHQYWSIAQMIAHHTAGGCNLRAGDLLGSGTVSGPGAAEAGALIELARGGVAPLALENGETRSFLADGDAVILKGWCHKPGYARIGFGECRGEILASDAPARSSPAS